MGWVMLLMLGVLVLVNLATSQSLHDDVEDRVTAALEQENEELRQFASVGVDPETGQPFAAARTGGIRQGAVPIYDVSTDEALRTQILESPFGTGSVLTPAGELRWQKSRVTPPEGSSAPAGWFVTGRFTQVDQAVVGATMRTLMLVSLAGLVLAGLGAWLVSGRILAPVRLVHQAAAQINEQDLTRRIPVHGRDDISALSEQFNAMLDRLEQAFSAQRQFVDDASHELRGRNRCRWPT